MAKDETVNLYALIVAVGKYKDESAVKLPVVPAATQLYDFLAERRGLFGKAHVALLIDEQATKANIVKALTTGLSKAGKKDIVIVYMESHGSILPSDPEKFYFMAYDSTSGKPETFLWVNNKELFRDVKSERLLFLTGSCFSGGFLTGLARTKGLKPSMGFLEELEGRFGISAASGAEVSVFGGRYGMSLFGFYLIKGLRGEADANGDGIVTVKELYDYISDRVVKDSLGAQHPQLFASRGDPEATPIYKTPVYSKELKIDVKFFYEAEDGQVKPLTDESVLKSRQRVGVAFKAESDCYVHVLWWDTNGKVGRLFPNPRLTEGDRSGSVQAGKTYWLPSKGQEKYWYVLDDQAGHETIYFVASRERNKKLEKLYEELQAVGARVSSAARVGDPARMLEREINLMGFADQTVPMKKQAASYRSREQLVDEFENKIKIAGADAVVRVKFKHAPGAAVTPVEAPPAAVKRKVEPEIKARPKPTEDPEAKPAQESPH